MGLVFRVKKFFDANAILVTVSTLLLLFLVVVLSIRLRAGEMATMFKIGCGKGTILSLILAELLIVFLVAAAIIGVGVWFVQMNADDLVRGLLNRT